MALEVNDQQSNTTPNATKLKHFLRILKQIMSIDSKGKFMLKMHPLSIEAKKLIFEIALKTKLKMQRANELVPCPFHKDSNASLSINIHKGVYNCFSCGTSGNIYTLLKLISTGEI